VRKDEKKRGPARPPLSLKIETAQTKRHHKRQGKELEGKKREEVLPIPNSFILSRQGRYGRCGRGKGKGKTIPLFTTVNPNSHLLLLKT